MMFSSGIKQHWCKQLFPKGLRVVPGGRNSIDSVTLIPEIMSIYEDTKRSVLVQEDTNLRTYCTLLSRQWSR